MIPEKEKPVDRYLSVQSVAETLACMDRNVYEMVQAGSLKAIRIGVRAIRISDQSLQAFIASRTIKPGDYSPPAIIASRTIKPGDYSPPAIKVARSRWMTTK